MLLFLADGALKPLHRLAGRVAAMLSVKANGSHVNCYDLPFSL